MLRRRRAQWLSEFFVIVFGVLVALAVDDFAQYRADRQLEADLLDRLADDLRADAADLAVAQVQVARRYWIFEALGSGLDGGEIGPAPDSLVRMERQASLLEALQSPFAQFAAEWEDLDRRPLQMLGGYPEFDISDDSYQEMLSRGALQVLRDPEVRTAVVAYYRVGEDLAKDVMVLEEYAFWWKETLADRGLSYGDATNFDQVLEILRGDRSLAAHARRAQLLLADQSRFLDEIESRRVALELALEQVAGAS